MMSNPNDGPALFGDGTTPTPQASTEAPKPKPARTPGPWSEGYDYDENEGRYILAQDGAGLLAVAILLNRDPMRFDDDLQDEPLPVDANMEYIVLACNHFEALLAVCEKILDYRKRWLPTEASYQTEIFREMEAAVKAVKDAQR